MRQQLSFLKRMGSLSQVASQIVSNFPRDYQSMAYIEPRFSNGEVFMHARFSPTQALFLNDDRRTIYCLFKSLRESDQLEELLDATPYEEMTLREAYKILNNDTFENDRTIGWARYVVSNMSFLSKGKQLLIDKKSNRAPVFHRRVKENKKMLNCLKSAAVFNREDPLDFMRTFVKKGTFTMLDLTDYEKTRQLKLAEKATECTYCIRGSKALILTNYQFDAVGTPWTTKTVGSKDERRDLEALTGNKGRKKEVFLTKNY